MEAGQNAIRRNAGNRHTLALGTAADYLAHDSEGPVTASTATRNDNSRVTVAPIFAKPRPVACCPMPIAWFTMSA